MNQGEFVTEFIAANLEKISNIGKKAFGKIDALTGR